LNAGTLSETASPEQRVHDRTDPDEGGTPPALSFEHPVDSALLPYIDAFLQNVHPVGCNNFLHPGVLGEALSKAPAVLILALCGVTAKFTNASCGQEQGRIWIEEARRLMFEGLDTISTLNITVLQFLATHEMQEGRFMAAWNLIGKTAGD
jgi:hypothetical protein